MRAMNREEIHKKYIEDDKTIGELATEYGISHWKMYDYLKKNNIIGLKRGSTPKREHLIEKEDLVLEWDFNKNKGIDINKITCGSQKKVWWKCKDCGHEWQAIINNRVNKHSGCPKCSDGNSISLREYAIYLILKGYYNNVISQYKINNMSLDIYIEDINTVIEYQGRYFHNNKFNDYNVESRDKDKRKFLSDNNIRLITLNETYDDEKIRVEGDNIYFNADNRSIIYICSIIVTELNKILGLSIEVPEDIEEQTIRGLKIKDIDDSLGKLYPEIAKEWNKDKNGVLNPFKIKPRSNKRVWWRCSKCDYEWITSPAHRVTDGTGCPRCLTLDGKCGGIHMVVAGVNDLETLFPHIADEWAYSKNTIDIKDISHKSNKTAFWVCSKCKKRYIEKVIARTQRNKGCPYCSNEDNVDEGVDLNAYV